MIRVVSDSNEIKKDEEFNISVNLRDMPASTLQLEIYFDKSKLEYVSGPEESNIVDNTLFYLWVDETGGDNPKQDGDILSLRFKGVEIGETFFGVSGKFFDKDGNEILADFIGTDIKVAPEKLDIGEVNSTENRAGDDAYLQVMRIGVEGISPDFNKNIFEYFLVVPISIDKLDIVAVPENVDAKVNVIGDLALKNGLNKILVEVVSSDESNKNVYTINVTKTSEPEKANADLEILAVEYYSLEPSFSLHNTVYNLGVSKDAERINVFAIPISTNASVKITGNESLVYGWNNVEVIVTAENGISIKKYIIKVYKRNEEEDIKEKENQEENQKKLDEILERKEMERLSSTQEIENNNQAGSNISVIILSALLMGLLIYVMIKKVKMRR